VKKKFHPEILVGLEFFNLFSGIFFDTMMLDQFFFLKLSRSIG